jgi:hypothetical protein
MRRETKIIIRAIFWTASLLVPVAALAQDEGVREVELPNPMTPHTWFIIVAVGAFLAWCISYVLTLQRERLSQQNAPQRESLLRRKEELLDRLTKLDAQKDAGTIPQARYDKEFRKARGQLSEILRRLGSPDSAER